MRVSVFMLFELCLSSIHLQPKVIIHKITIHKITTHTRVSVFMLFELVSRACAYFLKSTHMRSPDMTAIRPRIQV
ncbi:hypothetical protein BDD12DRAFT_308257 [Trichophaea hybrida]|nr:hypothetical protein BDD12DRAFT_308257 [Trichophaea hybrida]